MEHISELTDILNGYFGWNKARVGCFVNMLLALISTRTVNLNKLACVVSGDTQQPSRYRRLQRFFAGYLINYDQIAGLIFKTLQSSSLLALLDKSFKKLSLSVFDNFLLCSS